MALALSDSASEDSINLLSNARATAAASQDTLSTIETASMAHLDVSGFSASLSLSLKKTLQFSERFYKQNPETGLWTS